MTEPAISWRRWDTTTGDVGGLDVTADGYTIHFRSSANQSHGVSSDCPLCGATVTDWVKHEAGFSADRPNHIAHVRFHNRLENQ